MVFCRTDDTGNIARCNIGEYHAALCDTLLRELKERFGEENVKLVSKPSQKGKNAVKRFIIGFCRLKGQNIVLIFQVK